jgi:hypothetical protein
MSADAHHLHIVAACTDRKRGEIPHDLHLRNVPVAAAGERAEMWWRRLQAAKTLISPAASDVYAGEHWTQVQELAKYVRKAGWRVDVWIASAGYGLLSEQTRITPYSCTFADGSEDQVSREQPRQERVAYHQAWWSALARLRQDRDEPASLQALAAQFRSATFLVLCSPDYVKAMHADLVLATHQLHHPERLTIVTSGASWERDPLRDHVLAIDSRAQTVWGGTMQGLHARTAHGLLEQRTTLHGPFSTADLREKYEALVADTAKPETPHRARMTDEEVIDFLRAELAKAPDAGWTHLLRVLRGSGRACEQKRFRGLHAQIAEELRAGTTR